MTDPITEVILYSSIVALVFLLIVVYLTFDKRAARDADAKLAAYDALPDVPPVDTESFPLKITAIESTIYGIDAQGKEWRAFVSHDGLNLEFMVLPRSMRVVKE